MQDLHPDIQGALGGEGFHPRPQADERGAVIPIDPAPLVLVVDDELTPRSIVSRMVRSLGYRVRSCRSGATALAYLQEHPGAVRLVLADLGMPRMDGGELAERAQDLRQGVRVALMAGHHDPHVGDLIAGYADLPFLLKPVTFGDLAELLERLLGTATRAVAPPSVRRSGAARRASGSTGSRVG
jgi:CheY-like chemotaxis protein